MTLSGEGPHAAIGDPVVAQSGFRLSKWGLAGTVGCVVAALLPPFMTGALAVQMADDLHFGSAALGLAVSMFFCVAALASVPMGRAAERYGAARVLRLAGVGSAVLLLAIGVGARTLTVLVALLTTSGLAVAAAQPAASALIAHHAKPSRQGAVLGLKQASAAFAMFAGGLAVPTLAVTVGWRFGYVAAAVTALAAAALVPLAPHVGASSLSAVRLDARPLIVLAIGFGLGTSATNTLGTFIVQGAVHADMSHSSAGLLLVIGSGSAAAAYVLAGFAADARPGHELGATAIMLGVGAVSMGSLAIAQPLLFVIAVPVAFALGSGWPGLLNLAVIRAHPAVPGAATGTTQTGAYLGAVLGPPVFGITAEHISYGWAWAGTGTCAALAALVVLAARRMMSMSGPSG